MSEIADPIPQPPSGPILVEIDPDLIELIPHFLRNRRQEAADLRVAVRDGDVDTLADIAHRLKGLGGYGFDYITRAGKALEAAARSGNLDPAIEWIDGLDDYLDRVEPREVPGEG